MKRLPYITIPLLVFLVVKQSYIHDLANTWFTEYTLTDKVDHAISAIFTILFAYTLITLLYRLATYRARPAGTIQLPNHGSHTPEYLHEDPYTRAVKQTRKTYRKLQYKAQVEQQKDNGNSTLVAHIAAAIDTTCWYYSLTRTGTHYTWAVPNHNRYTAYPFWAGKVAPKNTNDTPTYLCTPQLEQALTDHNINYTIINLPGCKEPDPIWAENRIRNHYDEEGWIYSWPENARNIQTKPANDWERIAATIFMITDYSNFTSVTRTETINRIDKAIGQHIFTIAGKPLTAEEAYEWARNEMYEANELSINDPKTFTHD